METYYRVSCYENGELVSIAFFDNLADAQAHVAESETATTIDAGHFEGFSFVKD